MPLARAGAGDERAGGARSQLLLRRLLSAPPARSQAMPVPAERAGGARSQAMPVPAECARGARSQAMPVLRVYFKKRLPEVISFLTDSMVITSTSSIPVTRRVNGVPRAGS